LGPIAGIWKQSFLDATPLHEEIARRVNRPFKRKLGIQSVDINTGHVIVFDETLPQDI
jgi:hypothetical protein